MKTCLGIIGGSGLYDLKSLEKTKWIDVTTPWGEPSDQILSGEINGVQIYFLPRHGRGHFISPSKNSSKNNAAVIDPPALETRTAILLQKAEEMEINLPEDCAFFIAQQVKSNVRELEGALKRVAANAKFAKTDIDINLIKDSLRDVLAIQAKMVTIGNIQRVVSDYYNIKLSDLLSKRRNRSITRPRQIAMSLAKELTNHSLPEIGEAFGGRDHTTVIHACEKTKELKKENLEIDEDYKKLRRSLSA